MSNNFLKNIIENLNFGGRKNSNGDDIKINGNGNIIDKSTHNNYIDKSIHNNYYQKENNIELSEQAKRIYEEFKKSGYFYLSVFFDGEIYFVENGKNELSMDNLDKRMVKADIDNLVKCGCLRYDHEQKNVAVYYTLAKK